MNRLLFVFQAHLKDVLISIDQGDPKLTFTSPFKCTSRDHPRVTIQVPHTSITGGSASWKCPIKGCEKVYDFKISYPGNTKNREATSPDEEFFALQRRFSDLDGTVESRYARLEELIEGMYKSFEKRTHQVPSPPSSSIGDEASDKEISMIRKQLDVLQTLLNDKTALKQINEIKNTVDKISAEIDATKKNFT